MCCVFEFLVKICSFVEYIIKMDIIETCRNVVHLVSAAITLQRELETLL